MSLTQLHWLPCKNQFYPTSSLQLGPPPVCNIGFVTFHHLDLRPEAFSYFLPRISNNICDFTAGSNSEKAVWAGEGNDQQPLYRRISPLSSLVFATRITFVFFLPQIFTQSSHCTCCQHRCTFFLKFHQGAHVICLNKTEKLLQFTTSIHGSESGAVFHQVLIPRYSNQYLWNMKLKWFNCFRLYLEFGLGLLLVRRR